MFNIYATDYAPVDPITPPCDITPIFIGYKGENKARCLIFDLTECVETFGDGGFVISFIRQGDDLPYLVTDTDRLDNNAIWIITDTDTAVDGYGMVQLQYIVDDVVCKSALYRTVTFDSNSITGDVPDPYEDLLAQIAAYAAQAEGAATTATAAAQTATTAVEEGVKTERSQRIAADEGLNTRINELMGLAGAPSMANSAAAMTDSSKVYVYTGNEAGYLTGHWYYYNGAEWADGGVYQATAINTDKTLTVENMAADAAVVGEKIDECMAAFVVNSASGDIASFADGADGVPLKDLVVNVEPNQDLHGQANPYPAGGGKNLLEVLSNTQTVSGVTFTVNRDSGGNVVSVTANGTATANIYYQFVPFENSAETLARMVGKSLIASGISGGGTGQYLLRSQYRKNGTNYDVFSIGSGSAALSYPSDAEQISIQLLVYSGATINTTVYPMIRLASDSDATFAPYSNICPISGWTGANITRTGKNLFPKSIYGTTMAGITWTVYDDGSIHAQGTSTGRSYCFVTKYYVTNFRLKPGTYTYNLAATGTGASSVRSLIGGYKGNTMGSAYAGNIALCQNNSPVTFTVTEEKSQWYIDCSVEVGSSGITVDCMIYPQIEVGSTATDYEPYTANQYNVSFGSSAGTVYGGTLDVTTGMLTVDRVMVDLGTLSWVLSTSYSHMFAAQRTGAKIQGQSICSCYKSSNHTPSQLLEGEVSLNPTGYSSSPHILIKESGYSDAASFKTAMSGQILVYELAQPVSYPLTAHDIRTLLGNNNIFADCGTVDCEYRADTKLYIEHLTDPDSDMIADANITSGSYFMVNNSLYLATANIANGGAIIPGTNCTATNLAAALNAINS